MKQFLTRIFFVLCIITSINAQELSTLQNSPIQEYYPKEFYRSFMFTRPAYYQLSTEQALWHNIIYEEQKKSPHRASFQIYPFYQESINSSFVNRYFLFKGKNELLVAGDAVIEKLQTRDIRAEWLNLPSNFSGVLSVAAQQRQAGFVLEYLQHLYKWIEHDFFDNMFLDFTVPFVYVENNLHLTQTEVTNPGEQFPRNIIEAFDQPQWNFGKISPKARSLVNVAEVEMKLGSWYMDENFNQIAYYGLITLPIAKKQNAEFLFNPFVGNGQHICIGGAANFQILLNRDPSRYAWCFFLGLKSILRIKNKQDRTFDLVGKPWSRFMLYNTQGSSGGILETNVPGVNILTRRVTVRPYAAFDFIFGWRLKTEKLEFEFGYNAWGHMHDHIDNFVEQYPVPFGIAGSEPGTTASKSTIAFQAPNDPLGQFVTLNSNDLDRQSAEAGSALNQKFHMNAGFVQNGATLGAGFFIDIPQKNSSLETWQIWIKLATTF